MFQKPRVATVPKWNRKAIVLASFLLVLSPKLTIAQTRVALPTDSAAVSLLDQSDEAQIADLSARVELLTNQYQEAREEQRLRDETIWERILWMAGGLGTLFTLLIGIASLFISSRMKDPEEWRENLRTHLTEEMRESRHQVAEQTKYAIANTESRLSDAERSYAEKIKMIYATAREEARTFQQENAEILRGLRALTELGQPSPSEKPEPETLYFLAEQARAEGGEEGRAKGLRYLRRLAEDDLPAFAPVLHNAAVLAKQYESQEIALRLFRRAWITSGKTKRYSVTYAHELALAHHEVESLRIFEELRAQHPNDDNVFSFHIDSLRALQLYEQAEAAINTDGARFAKSALVQRELADLYYTLGRLEDANRSIDMALSLDPTDDVSWGYKARFAYEAGSLDLARKAVMHGLRVAGEGSPRVANLFQRLGDIERVDKHPDKAIEAYRASIIMQKAPSRAVAWLNILGPEAAEAGAGG